MIGEESAGQKPEPSLWLDEAGQATMRRHFEMLLEEAGATYFGPFFLLGALASICDFPSDLSERAQQALVDADRRRRDRERDLDLFAGAGLSQRYEVETLRREMARALEREDAERKRAERAEAERDALTDRVARLERELELARRPQ